MRINTHNNQPLLLNNQQIEQVSEFSYLGSIISKDNGGTDRDGVKPEEHSVYSTQSGDRQRTQIAPK
jgi:hypothetical protein